MTDVDQKLKSTITDIDGKNWADLCDSSQSSQSQLDYEYDSPLKSNENLKNNDDDDLYDMVFQSVKKENTKVATQDDLSLTSFMNNVHMMTPVKQENDKPSTKVVINEDTITSPFVKDESKYLLDKRPEPPLVKDEIKKDILYAKRRLTSECGPVVSEPITPERNNKFNKKSEEHKNIHDSVESPKTKLERETDALVLARRQKQIDFGKNTIGYEKYLEQIPKHKRKKEHPKTPPKNLKYTRRAWDGLVKNWRVRLHCWDPNNKNEDDDALTTGSSSNLCSLGSMTSLDSNSQASDSRPSTPPPTKRSSEDSSKREQSDAISSPDPVKLKKSKTENK